MDWYTIYRVPTAVQFANITDIRDYSMAITISFLCITIIAAVVLIHFSTRRLLRLSSDIGKFSRDNTNIEMRVSGRDEVGKVAKSVKDMLREIDILLLETHQQKEREKELLNENYSKELLRREAEFKALQMQINPHFLYNTLEMIKGMVYSDDPQKNIITATQALADMFRYNIGGDYIATIRDELEHIRAYLIIQNFRFDKVITLCSSLPEDILDKPIVRFTLEPLVENAIVHGFLSAAGHNSIRIGHEARDGRLIISLSDDGAGIEPSILEEIKNRFKYEAAATASESRRSNIGLQNVHLRLKQFFGPEYGLQIESARGIGTTLYIVLPLEREKPYGDEGALGRV